MKLELPIVTDEEWDSCNNYISKSRVALWDECQLKFKKQYVDKVLPREESHAMSIGTRYHQFMETFMSVAGNYDKSEWYSFIHPDFTGEEVPMLKWSIDREIERNEIQTVLANEYRVIDRGNELRGIIDCIKLSDNIIDVIEYKTGQSINKRKLQMEFGFYDILLDSVKELKGFKRNYTVINPRLKQVQSFTPSRRSTVMKRVNDIRNAVEYKPACRMDPNTFEVEYCKHYCMLCTYEEIAEYYTKHLST